MIQSKITSDELRQALEESRSAFLGKKITIDDISKDIRTLEDELNSHQAIDDFVFSLEKAGKNIFEEFSDVIDRQLVWKKYGSRWRLFYRSIFFGLTSTAGVHNFFSQTEESLIAPFNGEPPDGTELICKPLIDMTKEIRLKAHRQLPTFVRAMAADWTVNRYRRHDDSET